VALPRLPLRPARGCASVWSYRERVARRAASFGPVPTLLTLCVGAAFALAVAGCADGSGVASRRKASTTVTTTSPTSTVQSTLPAQAASGPCGAEATPPPAYDHVIWIWMENKTFDQVIGNAGAPYETS